MKDAIVEKLRQHLAGPIDTECKVVYLLCEIRKLVDDQPREKLSVLRLYSDWALHVDLTYPSTTQHFLEQVDSFVLNKLNPKHETRETKLAEDKLLRDFVSLETFRKELLQVLADHHLPTALCDDEANWLM